MLIYLIKERQKMAKEINGLDHLFYPESRAVSSSSSGLDVNDINNQRRQIADLLGKISPVIAGQLDPYQMSDKTVKWLAKKSTIGGSDTNLQLAELAKLNLSFTTTSQMNGVKNYNKNPVMVRMVQNKYPLGNPNTDRNVKRYLASIGALNNQVQNMDDKWNAVKYSQHAYTRINGITGGT